MNLFRFPRFYFISDGDLLEILGQSKDPNAVQKHLENCFEGIYKLKIVQTKGSNQTQGFQATEMISRGDESIPFIQPVVLEGAVEKWLGRVEDAMRSSIRRNLHRCYAQLTAISGSAREKWIFESPGQLIIAASMMFWTMKVESALTAMSKKGGKRNAMRELRRSWNSYLKKYTSMVRSDLSSLQRNKLVALITIEVHARDVVDKLLKDGVKDSSDFEWLKQLRFYPSEDGKEGCTARQITASIDYDNEYIGNTGR